MASIEQKLREGINAARNGDRTEGRRLLSEVVREDPQNELGWIWLASCVSTVRERRTCLENVLRINPNNETARRALAGLGEGNGQDVSYGGPSQSGGLSVMNLAIGLLVIVAVLGGLFLFSDAGPLGDNNNEPLPGLPTPTPLPPTPTPAPPTPTRTQLAFIGTSNAPTLPATFTPTGTPQPSRTPTPTVTPYPLEQFRMLISSMDTGQTEPDLYQYNGDGSDELLIGSSFRDVVYDPSGDRVAFVRDVAYPAEGDEEETQTFPELFIAGIGDLSNPQQITELRTSLVADPTWSPQGNEIVFVSDYDGSEDLWYVTPDGENLRRLTENDTVVDRSPAWSPVVGSRMIVFASDRDSVGATELYTFEITEPGVDPVFNRLTRNSNNDFAPSWSHNGEWITFISERTGDPDVYVMSPDGSRQFALADDDNDAEDRAPVFTPDGRYVVFVSNRQDDTFQTYLISVDGQVLQRLTNHSRNDQSVTFRPELILRLG